MNYEIEIKLGAAERCIQQKFTYRKTDILQLVNKQLAAVWTELYTPLTIVRIEET